MSIEKLARNCVTAGLIIMGTGAALAGYDTLKMKNDYERGEPKKELVKIYSQVQSHDTGIWVSGALITILGEVGVIYSKLRAKEREKEMNNINGTGRGR